MTAAEQIRRDYLAAGWTEEPTDDGSLHFTKRPAPAGKGNEMSEAITKWLQDTEREAGLDAATCGLNGAVPRRVLTAQERLDRREADLAVAKRQVQQEREAVRGESRLVITAWVLLVLTTGALVHFWPSLMAWADGVWRRG